LYILIDSRRLRKYFNFKKVNFGMARIKIPSPVSGGLILSYKCSAACRHCMYLCSPKWSADWISIEDLQTCLTQLAKFIRPSPYGSKNIGLSHGLHFSGGEPFLNFDLLVKATEMAEELNIPSTFVETNCFWCKSEDETKEKLELLRKKGLKGILISVNPYYAEYVPFERTERCIRISSRIFGRNMAVYQLEYFHQFMNLGIKEKISIDDFKALTEDEDIAARIEMFLMGRATRKLRDLYPKYPANILFTVPCQPPFLRSWHNHFDNYGNFMPGFCGGLSLGSWYDLESLIEDGVNLEEHPVLKYLMNDDMQGLFLFAHEHGYEELAEGYISKCDLCLDIRRHLTSKDDFKELKPKEYYEHLD
jgi:hypothetical protein